MNIPYSSLPSYPPALQKAVLAYYENYYRHQLGLPDWQERALRRIDEEENFGRPILQKASLWMNYNFSKKSILVVGAGTGAETFALHQLGANVEAIEPDINAIEILYQKAALCGMAVENLQQGVAERLPYKNENFDFVICNTVLEHVADVAKSVSEMVRVCKVGGLVYIQTPDYRFPYEGHYKTSRIAFSPKWLTAILFWLQGKPVRFIFSVNFVTAPELDKVFVRHNVTIYRILLPYLEWEHSEKSHRFFKFVRRFGFGKDQFIFLRKESGKP